MRESGRSREKRGGAATPGYVRSSSVPLKRSVGTADTTMLY
jgi:hypothetical protein